MACPYSPIYIFPHSFSFEKCEFTAIGLFFFPHLNATASESFLICLYPSYDMSTLAQTKKLLTALESLRSIPVSLLGPQSGRMIHLGLFPSLSHLTILNVWERWNSFALSRKLNGSSAQSKVPLAQINRFLNY